MLGFIRLRAAIEVIYELGMPLADEDFLDLEPDMLAALAASGDVDRDEEWFYIRPSGLGKFLCSHAIRRSGSGGRQPVLFNLGFGNGQPTVCDRIPIEMHFGEPPRLGKRVSKTRPVFEALQNRFEY